MNAPLAAVIAAVSLVCGVIDYRTRVIPNVLTLSALPLLLSAAALTSTLGPSLAGCTILGGSLLALHALTRGRGIGMGDVKLAACMGAGLGVSQGVVALGVAFMCGALVAVVLIAARKARRGDAIAFGPFLAAGTIAGIFLRPWTALP